MFALAEPWWTFLLRTLVVYLALLAALRLFGRRQLGQMTPFDLVVILLIANALQNAMVGADVSVTGGLLAALTLLTVNRIVTVAGNRIPLLRRATEGEPILLIAGGQVLAKPMRREHIDVDDLTQAAHEHGLKDLSEVDTAILEVDGTVSIIQTSGERVRTESRVGRAGRRRSHRRSRGA